MGILGEIIFIKLHKKANICGHKDIHVDTLDQKNYENENINSDDKNNQLKVNTIKINIDKNILKNCNNSTLLSRYNKKFKKFNDNKKERQSKISKAQIQYFRRLN